MIKRLHNIPPKPSSDLEGPFVVGLNAAHDAPLAEHRLDRWSPEAAEAFRQHCSPVGHSSCRAQRFAIASGRRASPSSGTHRRTQRTLRLTQAQAERLKQYAPSIFAAAKKYHVPAVLIFALILVESNGFADTTSGKGAGGLMQIIPPTAEHLGITDVYDPAQNIDGGTRYLGELLKRYGGRINFALAAYNLGWPSVKKKIPDEIRPYVTKVRQYISAIKPLLKTFPKK